MKQETLHPEFFTLDGKRIIELKYATPIYIGVRTFKQTLGSITPMATIPMYSFAKEGSRKRKQMEKAYNEQRLIKYNEVKKLYDENIFLGIVFCSLNGAKRMHTPLNNDELKRSCKITKIFIDDKEGVGYVCYKASDESIELVNKENESQLEFYKKEKKKNKKFQFIHRPLKPIASGKFSLINFISAIYQSNPYLKIINNPNKPKPIKKK